MFQLCSRAPAARVVFQVKAYSPRAARSLFICANNCRVSSSSRVVGAGGCPYGASPFAEFIGGVPLEPVVGVTCCWAIDRTDVGVGGCVGAAVAWVSGCPVELCPFCPHAASRDSIMSRQSRYQNF